MTQIAIVGAGAVGSCLAGLLAAAGQEVALIGRSPAHLEAIEAGGLHLATLEGEQTVALPTARSGAAPGPADLVLFAVKAHDLPQAVTENLALIGPDTVTGCVVNGVPWWYPLGLADWSGPRTIRSVDPDGTIAAALAVERTVGIVAYVASSVPAPGKSRIGNPPRLVVGEPAPGETAKAACDRLCEALAPAALQVDRVADIRTTVWRKLWGNAVFNPLTALTRQPLDASAQAPDPHGDLQGLMAEVEALIRRLGIDPGGTAAQRVAEAADVGPHRTSMLQDVEAGRRMEIGAIVDAVVELAGAFDVPCPRLSLLSFLAHGLDSQRPGAAGR
jgi:2-dehydropantoate 2-reductase